MPVLRRGLRTTQSIVCGLVTALLKRLLHLPNSRIAGFLGPELVSQGALGRRYRVFSARN